MKYVVDTNILLRFLLKDNEKMYQQVENLLKQAKENKTQLILIPQVLFELNYVLNGVYHLTKKEICLVLKQLTSSPVFKVINKEIILNAIEIYKKTNVDLIDAYLFYTAKDFKAKILTFDKDFKKIK